MMFHDVSLFHMDQIVPDFWGITPHVPNQKGNASLELQELELQQRTTDQQMERLGRRIEV